ncbi:MAG TPA: DUF1080 domain-containing protein [Chitinophagaceae bacterium]|jgi:hypothetical protein|nr:DUF1080 domain-containing protein [Chitinophagaceae bacterium]
MTKTLIGLMIMIVLNVNGLAQNAGASQSSGKNQLSSNEKKEGWKTLFDGQSTAGWHSYGRAAAGPSWKVADGSIYYDTANEKTLHDRDLVTNNAYENYHIKYEWKIAPKGNSGFLFNVNEDTSKYKLTYVTGLEMQVIDNNGHPDAKNPKHRAGDLYDLIAVSKETVRPVGEYNQAEVMLNKGKLDLFLNGAHVVSTTMWDENWNQLVANSKFKSMPGFAKTKKGRFALQAHGSMVWFRNIKIKEL